MSERQRIDGIEGRPIPVRGHDIDTDRILPARFLVAITFAGLEAHVFEDERRDAQGRHPFDDVRYAGARILIVNRNFGCGSSREHAPQAIQRWGIAAVIGESFSEIFFGNAVAIGMPCVTAPREVITALQEDAEQRPDRAIRLDLRRGVVESGAQVWPVTLPAAVRDAFVSGDWDATGLLLERPDEVQAVAARLPYVSGWAPPA